MLLATKLWNDSIARYVIDTYSGPFETVFNAFNDCNTVTQISEELLRLPEPFPKVGTLYDHMCSLPANLFNLICFDAEFLLAMNLSDRHNLLDEAQRLLVPGGYCTFVIADAIRSGKIVPNGFQLVHLFMSKRFKVATIVDEKASRGLPFQLAPHQYLAVFQKPVTEKKRPLKQTALRSRISFF